MIDHTNIILAADIGGTNARFACLLRDANEKWAVKDFAKFRVNEFLSFEDALQNYHNTLDIKPALAAFAAAGAVEDNFINLTNANWQISTERAMQVFGFEQCILRNDFAGMTRSIPELSKDKFNVIREGHARIDAPILVAGPGTGFGVGYLIPTRSGWHVMTTEGGHQAYAPQNAKEMEILKILKLSYDFVSLELVSSGSGLVTMHKAICEMHSTEYKYITPSGIRDKALAGDPICADICEIRASATMGAIGDLAMQGGARGGIFLAGGVSESMINFFIKPEAMNRFLSRGPQSAYVRDIPMSLLNAQWLP